MLSAHKMKWLQRERIYRRPELYVPPTLSRIVYSNQDKPDKHMLIRQR